MGTEKDCGRQEQAAPQSAQTPVPLVPEAVPGAGQPPTAPDAKDHGLEANAVSARQHADPPVVAPLQKTAANTNDHGSEPDAASAPLDSGHADLGPAPHITALTENALGEAGLEGDGAADDLNAPAGRIPFHPLNFFPMLDEETQHDLTRDIANNDLLRAIVLHEGKILDGRGRYIACILAGREPRFENYAREQSAWLRDQLQLASPAPE
jgi:hypothetical protein